MKHLYRLFLALVLLLSHGMCFVTAWNYRDMLCGIAHSCYSAPPESALLSAVPYALGILLFGLLAAVIRKKAN